MLQMIMHNHTTKKSEFWITQSSQEMSKLSKQLRQKAKAEHEDVDFNLYRGQAQSFKDFVKENPNVTMPANRKVIDHGVVNN